MSVLTFLTDKCEDKTTTIQQENSPANKASNKLTEDKMDKSITVT